MSARTPAHERIGFHPADELLFEYAAGAVDAVLEIFIATHLTYCPRCRNEVADYEAIGGALLVELPELIDPVDVRLRVDLDAPEASPSLPLPPTVLDIGGHEVTLPRTLASLPLRAGDIRWRTLTPGWRVAEISPASGPSPAIYLFNVEAGREIPRHRHEGLELDVVLAGAIVDPDRGVRYTVGDYFTAETGDMHRLQVPSTEICLVLHTLIGRVEFT